LIMGEQQVKCFAVELRTVGVRRLVILGLNYRKLLETVS